jgi:hypothetical protein
MAFGMNKQRERHMAGAEAGQHGDPSGHSQAHPPSIHIHSHDNGVTVHILHHDGQHEEHEHEKDDAEGIASHVHEHFGHGGGHEADEGNEGFPGPESGAGKGF